MGFRTTLGSSIEASELAADVTLDTIGEGTTYKKVTAAEKLALAGTSGTPGTANPYVTNDDPRISAAATQTVTASNQTLVHNGTDVLNVSLTGSAFATHTLGATAQAIQDGSRVGHKLLINVVNANGANYNSLIINDNAATAKTNIGGAWRSCGKESDVAGWTWLLVVWNGTVWQEISRYDGFGWSVTGSLGHGEGDGGSNAAVCAHLQGKDNVIEAGANYSDVVGKEALVRLYAQRVHSSGKFAATGDAQAEAVVCRLSVTHDDSDWHSLLIDGSGATVLPDIPTDTVWTFTARVVGTTQGCTKSFCFILTGGIKNDGGTVSLLNQSLAVIHRDDADFSCQAAADDTNKSLLIQVTDSTSGSDVVRWVTDLQYASVTFPA